MVRQTTYRIPERGVGTTAVGVYSGGERLGSILTEPTPVGIYGQGTGRVGQWMENYEEERNIKGQWDLGWTDLPGFFAEDRAGGSDIPWERGEDEEPD